MENFESVNPFRNDISRIADKLHASQYDKQGYPYILHVHAVGSSIGFIGDEAYAAGLLHDVIEDAGVSKNGVSVFVGDRVANAVDKVSRVDRSVSYNDFIESIVDVQSYSDSDFLSAEELENAGIDDYSLLVPLAAVVKIADNMHNSLGVRADGLSDSMKKRYSSAREKLMSVVPYEIYSKIQSHIESALF